MSENVDFRKMHQFLGWMETPCSIWNLEWDVKKNTSDIVFDENFFERAKQFFKWI